MPDEPRGGSGGHPDNEPPTVPFQQLNMSSTPDELPASPTSSPAMREFISPGQVPSSQTLPTCRPAVFTPAAPVLTGESHGKRPLTSENNLLARQLQLLKRTPDKMLSELESTPLFTRPVLLHAQALDKLRFLRPGDKEPFSQYGLIGESADAITPSGGKSTVADPSVFYNVATPSSTFICGSQGSGKSHTLSCLLESCLLPSRIGKLPRPLTGLVFHYDPNISDAGSRPCEAAFISSHPDAKVRVLCPSTNIRNMKETYACLPNVKVEELRLGDTSLNNMRMLALLGASAMGESRHIVQSVLRDLDIERQHHGGNPHFNYKRFRHKLEAENMSTELRAPLQQRLDTLETFLATQHVGGYNPFITGTRETTENSWIPENGQLTIVDLSCPCVTPEMACSLFHICLVFCLSQNTTIGQVIALDNAHKYMNDSVESQTLTGALLGTIHRQRHCGTRVIISTQEPTISHKFLDLCSMTIVHRFTSPDWLPVLEGHLAGISTPLRTARGQGLDGEEAEYEYEGLKGIEITGDATQELFSQIAKLRTGEALVFAPTAVIGLKRRTNGPEGDVAGVTPRQLAGGVLRIVVREQITEGGGKSTMAS
ncbi:hypothetical protein GGS24DRAFT_501942 [Hypoxylon argillaceum]|nr:hypothetical protein GGS24DRAFT_501942 [Hypoxylon argillaceum]